MLTLPHQLVELITKSLATVEAACTSKGLTIPDLYEPFHPSSEAFRADPHVAEAAAIISAAALHLEAIFTPPQVSLYHVVSGFFKSTALRVCLESNVTEILREGGPQGVHIDAIAAKNGQDPQKLGRFIRYLATHHIYKEITPDVYTNTRVSSVMDTMKPSQEIISHPKQKHDNTMGLAALVSHHLDEAFKASAYGWETLADATISKSTDVNATPFSRAFKTNDTLWEFYNRPEQSFRHHRFGLGMRGVETLQPPNAIIKAFEWRSLAKGSVVVDVGGGIGTSSLPLARDFPDINIVLQDLPRVIEDAKKHWDKIMPDAVKTGRVKLEAHDFFEAQPQKTASIFLLKQIMHDWSDAYCAKILIRLRASAIPTTKLLILDSIMPFTCHDPSADNDSRIPGAVPKEAPAPLLANFGAVSELIYCADSTMFTMFNSQERTITQFETLLLNTGWKLTIVRRQEGDSTFLQSIEAVPT
ncbi:S-adenosyl-L-methionine-dependent methyltransferase [Gautieria morchelliformis]|nr:S-adenosyl-L-methionine-dependent methyltransferase [Gautieria morchelliformis]